MTRQVLIDQIFKKRSFLSVGLDSDIDKIPEHLKKEKDPLFAFNKAIIDATHEYCVAYKLNIAFYEALGVSGWESMEKTIAYIPENILKIADAKRGDIGNTSEKYAQAFFDKLKFDAITLSPYMGEDTVKPFLAYKNKWSIILALTSNKSSADFQYDENNKESQPLFEKVTKKISEWGTPENTMLVVGATHPDSFKKIRAIVPDHFLLVPGVGAQGGSLSQIAKAGMNKDCGLLVNSSRGIIYAGKGNDFQEAAKNAAAQMQKEMELLLRENSLVK
ncbi:MAG: orotidine-5'-phosphate decarboxylase [Chitinophagales bacterium]